jgi:hypothetical protein
MYEYSDLTKIVQNLRWGIGLFFLAHALLAATSGLRLIQPAISDQDIIFFYIFYLKSDLTAYF